MSMDVFLEKRCTLENSPMLISCSDKTKLASTSCSPLALICGECHPAISRTATSRQAPLLRP